MVATTQIDDADRGAAAAAERCDINIAAANGERAAAADLFRI